MGHGRRHGKRPQSNPRPPSSCGPPTSPPAQSPSLPRSNPHVIPSEPAGEAASLRAGGHRSFNYILTAFTDIFFVVVFAVFAVAVSVHLHEIAFHLFVAAATFAVVRVSEYRTKKGELRELCHELSAFNDSRLKKLFHELHEEYEDWRSIFDNWYWVVWSLWFVTTAFVSVAMKDCTNAMIAATVRSGDHSMHEHRFDDFEYWGLPQGASWVAAGIAGAAATFAFVVAINLTIRCRLSEYRKDTKRMIKLFVDKMNSNGGST